MVLHVTCPTCGKPVPWSPESTFRPFCSKRCQLIDLGEWVNEEKAIPGESEPTRPWVDQRDDFDD